jgi:hypothetical protein
MIIGISGRIGSGKDTIGTMIQYLDLCAKYPAVWGDTYNKQACAGLGTWENFILKAHTWESKWQIKKFADKLKQCASIITGIPRKGFEDMSVKDSSLGVNWGNMSVRQFLQFFGTEVGRQIHPDIWVNALFTDYKCIDQWIITDVRFPNELRAVEERGGITIKVIRGQSTSTNEHISETALDYAIFDYEINNNGSLEELLSKVKDILTKEGII